MPTTSRSRVAADGSVPEPSSPRDFLASVGATSDDSVEATDRRPFVRTESKRLTAYADGVLGLCSVQEARTVSS